MEINPKNLTNKHEKTMKKVKKICKHCGSEDVVRDVWAAWDETQQKWILDDTFDFSFCKDCDEETTIIDKEVES